MLATEVVGLSPWVALLATVIVFAGAATQASIGIGLGLLAAPSLSLIDPGFIPGAISLGVVPLTIGMAIREWDHIDPTIYQAVVGRVAGIVVGGWMLTNVGDDGIAIVIGVSVLLAVIGSASGVRFAPSRRNLVVAGTASGFSGTVAGIGGPPMALTYQHADPRTLRSSLAAFNTIGSGFTIPTLVIAGVIGWREVQLALLLIPGILAGLWFGRLGVTRLPADRVRAFVLVVCAGSAVALLADQII